MEWHRVKTIMIVLLLTVNAFLLVLVGTRSSQAYHYEQAALSQTIQVLERSGIAMEPEAAAALHGVPAGTTQRSVELEAQIAAVLLGGPVEANSRGGGLYTYTNQLGEISFRAGGGVSAQLADHLTWLAADPDAHAAALIRELVKESELVSRDLTEGSGTIVYRQHLDGVPLFSCQLAFLYEDSRLVGLSGQMLAVEETALERDENLELTTVLMQFLDEILKSGDVCSAVLSVEPGYLLGQSLTNTVQLRPVWYISTNTSDYYVDGINGSLTRVE